MIVRESDPYDEEYENRMNDITAELEYEYYEKKIIIKRLMEQWNKILKSEL